jgi:hypothetical protein
MFVCFVFVYTDRQWTMDNSIDIVRVFHNYFHFHCNHHSEIVDIVAVVDRNNNEYLPIGMDPSFSAIDKLLFDYEQQYDRHVFI